MPYAVLFIYIAYSRGAQIVAIMHSTNTRLVLSHTHSHHRTSLVMVEMITCRILCCLYIYCRGGVHTSSPYCTRPTRDSSYGVCTPRYNQVTCLITGSTPCYNQVTCLITGSTPCSSQHSFPPLMHSNVNTLVL